ncbi:MAG: DUF2190 family protein [bacterium]|nr:DUF2190 family protein [bacterium]
MANVDRFRRDDDYSTAPVATGDLIERGDMVGLVSGAVKNAEDTATDVTLTVMQTAFVKTFAGVAMEDSQVGETAEILIKAKGVFEFACAAATFARGALVGPAKQTGDYLESQKVVAVATELLAIGRVAKTYAANTTTVLVQIFSTTAGYRANAEL